jgi:hypothetical protein
MDRADALLAQRGQLFGFLIAMLFLGASTAVVLAGHDVAGTILGTIDLVALVTVFVVGRRSSDTTGRTSRRAQERLLKQLSRVTASPLESQPAAAAAVPQPKDAGDLSDTSVSSSTDADPSDSGVDDPKPLEATPEDYALWQRLTGKVAKKPES